MQLSGKKLQLLLVPFTFLFHDAADID